VVWALEAVCLPSGVGSLLLCPPCPALLHPLPYPTTPALPCSCGKSVTRLTGKERRHAAWQVRGRAHISWLQAASSWPQLGRCPLTVRADAVLVQVRPGLAWPGTQTAGVAAPRRMLSLACGP